MPYYEGQEKSVKRKLKYQVYMSYPNDVDRAKLNLKAPVRTVEPTV